MENVDIVIETTWAASTSYIPLPDGFAPIDWAPTTLWLQGADGIIQANKRNTKSTGVQINYQAVKYNVLKLRYMAVGELVRT